MYFFMPVYDIFSSISSHYLETIRQGKGQFSEAELFNNLFLNTAASCFSGETRDRTNIEVVL